MSELLFGIHTIEALLTIAPERIYKLYYQMNRHDARFQALLCQAQRYKIPVEALSKHALDQRVPIDAHHQGVIADCKPASAGVEKDLFAALEGLQSPPLLLVLDSVQDPHNLGACLRSAHASGVTAVLANKHQAVGLTRVVRKVSCAASELIPFIQVINLTRTLEQLKQRGFWVYGLVAEKAQRSIYQTDLSGPLALVLGSEGKGLRRLTQMCCDALLTIPMQGSISSLNVSVAAGIVLFEARRQRMV